MNFVINKKYYRDIVYEWNLPVGTTCPMALDCKVVVDRKTGKFKNTSTKYKCYASSPERFPAVREHRWHNFSGVLKGEKIIIPKACERIRIHTAGDFYNQKYFDYWLELAFENPRIEMWAYTKSISFWVNRIDLIPKNLILTASFGGREDYLIEQNKLKNVIVYKNIADVPSDRMVDRNDDLARTRKINFALLDNKFNKKRYRALKIKVYNETNKEYEMQIEIKCKGALELPLDSLLDFQGDLKTLSDENYLKFKSELLELGFSEPISIWVSPEGKNYILNGHQRRKALLKLQEEGYEIPLIPVSLIEADNIKQAKKKVLALTSQFGTLTQDGLINFCEMNELNIDDMMKEFRFPEIPSLLIEDFSEKNKEIDTDLFSNEMELKFKFKENIYILVKEKLSELGNTPENALLKLLGIENNE